MEGRHIRGMQKDINEINKIKVKNLGKYIQTKRKKLKTEEHKRGEGWEVDVSGLRMDVVGM